MSDTQKQQQPTPPPVPRDYIREGNQVVKR